MVTKTKIDSEDLLKLENKINKEQQDARHQQNNSIQIIWWEVDNIKTSNTLLTQTVNIMKEDIKEIKSTIKDWFEKITHQFEILDGKYATKEEHKENKDLIKKLEADNQQFKIMIAKWMWWASVISVIVWFVLNKIF